MNKFILVVVGMFALSGCYQSKMYSIKAESGDSVSEVPNWYMSDLSTIKDVCGTEKGRQCIYGVGTSVSPDLNLAIEKAKMLAKAELADMIKGEMNKQSKQFITEIGKTEKRTVVAEAESILVNEIAKTPVRGYEIFAQDVTLTSHGYYRAWIGLRLPMGKFNKMYNYTVEQAVNAYNTRGSESNVFDDFMSSIEDEENENNNIQ